MRIAHISPLPPQKTGIADYCARLLPYLAQEVRMDVFGLPGTAVADMAIHPIAQLPERRFNYDLCFYHMGNQPTYHQQIYEMATRYPGVVVLHEVNLHGFFAAQSNAVYIREMGFAQGLIGVDSAQRVRWAGQLPPVMDYPLLERIWRASLGVIVHTQAAYDTLAAKSVKRPLQIAPLAVDIPKETNQVRPKYLENLPSDTFLLGSFGHIAPSKRIEQVLIAVKKLSTTKPIRLLLVGKLIEEYDLPAMIAQMGLEEIVIQTGYVSKKEYAAYLHHIDIGINLRSWPTSGEMSASLLDLLAHRKPVLVSDVDSFKTLPETVVFKIPQDEQEPAHIAAALQKLMAENSLREQIGKAARAYVVENCSFPQTARKLANFMYTCWETIVQGTPNA